MQYLILSADVWEMTDEKTGKTNTGVSVWYVNDYREDTKQSVGFKPTKISADEKLFKIISQNPLPALYELDFISKPGAQGKASFALVACKFTKAVEVFKK